MTEELALRYFHSWQEPADFTAFRDSLADDVVFDSGFMVVESADELERLTRETESPWKDVTLLDSVFLPDLAVLFYEGVDRSSGQRVRVAEHLTVQDGRIARIRSVIAPLPREGAGPS